ncbi:MAG TPA: hypothetical protein VFV47_05595 [Hyphomicrobiaceae bacterium]|nr:hypothetical protein [Hyphomicrobiaceae bacterium]
MPPSTARGQLIGIGGVGPDYVGGATVEFLVRASMHADLGP